MVEVILSNKDKAIMQKRLLSKLNMIGADPSKTSSDWKFMFITLLVQYLYTRDIGLAMYTNGSVIIEDDAKFLKYAEEENFSTFLTKIVMLRNKIVCTYPLPKDIELINEMWNNRSMDVLCESIGVIRRWE